MTNLFNKSLVSALSFLFIMAFSPLTSATENPFGMSNMDTNQITVAEKDKMGEGKCGGSDKKEGKCGEGKCGGDKKADGKKGEGKCGDDKKGDGKKGKCGEGKCGGK